MHFKTITPVDAAREAGAGALQLVDIRPPADVAQEPVARALNIPFGELAQRLEEIDASRPVAFICRAGVKSQEAAQLAAEHGLDAWNVDGGAAAWHEQVGAPS